MLSDTVPTSRYERHSCTSTAVSERHEDFRSGAFAGWWTTEQRHSELDSESETETAIRVSQPY